MIKSLLNFIVLLIFFIFFYLIIENYLSDNNKKKVNLNRQNTTETILNKTDNLTRLKNDTNNVIEFNTGYNIDEKKIKQSWIVRFVSLSNYIKMENHLKCLSEQEILFQLMIY